MVIGDLTFESNKCLMQFYGGFLTEIFLRFHGCICIGGTNGDSGRGERRMFLTIWFLTMAIQMENFPNPFRSRLSSHTAIPKPFISSKNMYAIINRPNRSPPPPEKSIICEQVPLPRIYYLNNYNFRNSHHSTWWHRDILRQFCLRRQNVKSSLSSSLSLNISPENEFIVNFPSNNHIK